MDPGYFPRDLGVTGRLEDQETVGQLESDERFNNLFDILALIHDVAYVIKDIVASPRDIEDGNLGRGNQGDIAVNDLEPRVGELSLEHSLAKNAGCHHQVKHVKQFPVIGVNRFRFADGHADKTLGLFLDGWNGIQPGANRQGEDEYVLVPMELLAELNVCSVEQLAVLVDGLSYAAQECGPDKNHFSYLDFYFFKRLVLEIIHAYIVYSSS